MRYDIPYRDAQHGHPALKLLIGEIGLNRMEMLLLNGIPEPYPLAPLIAPWPARLSSEQPLLRLVVASQSGIVITSANGRGSR